MYTIHEYAYYKKSPFIYCLHVILNANLISHEDNIFYFVICLKVTNCNNVTRKYVKKKYCCNKSLRFDFVNARDSALHIQFAYKLCTPPIA